MSQNDDIRYIDTAGALQQFCTDLGTPGWIALDTEFLREKTYYPKLCLLQIATTQHVACIDPIAISDLGPVLELVFNEQVIKVMHSGRQDLEILYHLCGKVPSPVFDTQIAALLLGYPEQVGYANLVRDELGVALDKLHTRADWSLRPLSPEQIRYAADDVIHLAEVYRQLTNKLDHLQRSDWLGEDFQRLINPALYDSPPEDAWLKVKGGNRIRGESLAVMQALAGWRERVAREKDRPKGWILRDDALVDIARHRPSSIEALGKIRGLSEGFVRHSGNRIVELIRAAAGKKPTPFPDKGRTAKLSADQGALVDVMMALVRLSGERNNLNPAVLANRKQLERLVLGDTDVAVLHGWRSKLVGEQLLTFIQGGMTLSVQDGRLLLVE
jgi:ribonuclease D